MRHNIITLRKRDVKQAHQAFVELMTKTELLSNKAVAENVNFCRGMSSSEVERFAFEKIKVACSDTPFNPNDVRLISGHKFPDIIASEYYGIEVKSTKDDHWTSIGSSIMETTRVVGVEDIYMFFGKLGGVKPAFKCRPYQDVLYDIAVTHSPRYLINMELNENETIFDKIGISYNEFRISEDPISEVRRYYREMALKKQRQEMPWWITSDNVMNTHSFNLRLWNALTISERRELQAKCLILFPEALNPISSKNKYNNVTLWLCAYKQVINPNIRDLYSSGGKITHVNGQRLERPIPQVFSVIVNFCDDVKSLLDNPDRDLLALISEFIPNILFAKNRFERWVDICCEYADAYNIPLREWMRHKPLLQYSK